MMGFLKYNSFLLVSLVFSVGSAYGARLLCIASVPTFSHNVFFRPIWKALADRGHQLTVLTTNPMEEQYGNIHEIDLNYVYERKEVLTNLTWTYSNWLEIIKTYKNMFKDVFVMELNHPEVQNILRNESEYFDLVIAEMHIPWMFGFSHRFKCPLIGISSAEILGEHHALLGNPTHPILYPHVFSPHYENTFLYRVMAIYFEIQEQISKPKQRRISQEILKMYFGPDVPSLDDLIKRVQFVLINIHPLFNVRPLSSKFVLIGGGAHIQSPKPLPKALQKLLDNSPQGAVYFSLGTNVKVEQYPSHLINTTIEAFKELPYQVIWKFNYQLPNLPNNVKILKWLPQQDLLRHPNIKVFITQGGLHSIDESIDAGIPMIGIPFVSDQNKNIRDVVERGLGIYLNKNTFTKHDLKQAITEVIENIRYKETVVAISQLLRDQPMTGLEKAVWYAEYAIRNKQRHHLLPTQHRSIPWYQYYLLDIIGATCLALFVVLYLLYKGLKTFAKLIIRISWRLWKIKTY